MIIFEKATKQFGDNPPSVEEISFAVEEGEFIFLTGHSGSGKTTLLKLLTKEYLLTSGEIEFDGQPLTKLKSGKVHHHRRKIGVVYQDYRLLPELNVWENIALALEIIGKPKAEIEERVTDLLELVQLTDKAFFFPAELSGGESQRVGIARALATGPNLLLADEPTGNLDPENTLLIARLFSKIHELGTTVMFATHDLMVLDHLGHRRIKLEKGKVLEDTPAKPHAQKPTPKKEAVEEEKPVSAEKKAEAAPDKEKAPKEEKKADVVETKSESKEKAETKKPEPVEVEVEIETILATIAPEKDSPKEFSLEEKEKKEEEKDTKDSKPGFHFSLFGKKSNKNEKKSEETTKKLANAKPKVDIIIEEL